jgi:hypothetical protein
MPLFGGEIGGIAINQFWQVPKAFWLFVLLFIGVPEVFDALRGWMEPTAAENLFPAPDTLVIMDSNMDSDGCRVRGGR